MGVRCETASGPAAGWGEGNLSFCEGDVTPSFSLFSTTSVVSVKGEGCCILLKKKGGLASWRGGGGGFHRSKRAANQVGMCKLGPLRPAEQPCPVEHVLDG